VRLVRLGHAKQYVFRSNEAAVHPRDAAFLADPHRCLLAMRRHPLRSGATVAKCLASGQLAEGRAHHDAVGQLKRWCDGFL